MKKTVSLLLIFAMLFLLVSCFEGDDTSSLSTSSTVENLPQETGKIGLIQYASHPTLDIIREEFMKRLDSWGFEEAYFDIDYQNANGDAATASSICDTFIADGVDMIVAISTPAAKAAVAAAKETDTKVVFVAVNNPTEDLGIVNPEAPEGNVTGTSDKVSAQAIIDLALKINPGIKNFGFAFDTAESCSVKIVEEGRNYLNEKEIKAVEGVFSSGADYQQVMRELCAGADMIFLPTDNTVAMHMDAVVGVSKELKKPVLAAADAMVQQGALAAVAVDYVELAAKSADMVVEILSGKSISEMPVQVFSDYNTYVNQTTLEEIGATIPDEVMQGAIFYN